MERLKKRKTPLNSKSKITSAIVLYEQYVDEPIQKIEIWSSTSYTINDKWSVNLSTNKVDRSYPDPSYD